MVTASTGKLGSARTRRSRAGTARNGDHLAPAWF